MKENDTLTESKGIMLYKIEKSLKARTSTSKNNYVVSV